MLLDPGSNRSLIELLRDDFSTFLMKNINDSEENQTKTSCCRFIFHFYVYKPRMDRKCCWMLHVIELNRA